MPANAPRSIYRSAVVSDPPRHTVRRCRSRAWSSGSGGRTRSAEPDGCDPTIFGDQIASYLERAAQERAVDATDAADVALFELEELTSVTASDASDADELSELMPDEDSLKILLAGVVLKQGRLDECASLIEILEKRC